MSREIRGFHPDHQIEEDNQESKENGGGNFSIVLADELVRKVNAKGELGLNDYQRSCKYALLCTRQTDLAPPWHIGDLDGFLRFYRDLPEAVAKSDDDNAEIFFCGSKYDLPVESDIEKTNNESSITVKAYRTPDGIIYRKILSNTQNGRKGPLFQILERAVL